jgi:regulator of RNase E activity RraA
MVSYAAVKSGVAGAVIDGSVCDYQEIMELGFPVFCRGLSPLTTRILGVEGEIGYTVCVDGVPVNSGDLVFGDDDGVAILPQEYASQIVGVLEEKERGEPVTKSLIDSGRRLSEISGAARFLSGGNL